MRLKKKNLVQNEKGQAVVELALMLPILMLIICGIIEMGWLFSNKLMLSNISREGARFGVIYSLDSNQLQDIRDKVLSLIPAYAQNEVTVNVSYSDTITPRRGDIVVDVTYQAHTLTPFTDIFASNGYQLSSKCVMKLE